MLYATLSQGNVFVALLFFGALAALICEPIFLLAKVNFKNKKLKQTWIACCDVFICLSSMYIFLLGLLWCNFGEFRVFCLVAFLLGFWIEKLTISKSVAFLLAKSYNACTRLCKILGSKLWQRQKAKQKLGSAKAQ